MGTMLVADDDPDILRIWQLYFEQKGHEVVACKNGAEAFRAISERTFDVVVTDIMMPSMDGIQFLKKVRSRDMDVPVIVVTGGPLLETAIHAVEYGAFRYLVKPVPLREFADIVTRAMGLHQLAKLKRQALGLIGNEDKHSEDLVLLESRFENAIDSLWMAYQPIISANNQEIQGYEALLRTKEIHLESPTSFFKAAQQLGRVCELSSKIRDTVANAAADIPKELIIYINLHPYDLDDQSLYSSTSKLSKISNRVVLEISEQSSFSNLRKLKSKTKQLRDMGFRIAFDDLGTGYSGMTSLAHLEPDMVKLDMTLIRGVDKIEIRQQIVGSFMSICADLGIDVICEGVETIEELKTLVKLGGDLFQGNLFSRPSARFYSKDDPRESVLRSLLIAVSHT